MPQTTLSIMIDHWFWLCIVAAVIAWYSSITIYIAIRGAFDIKNMFTRLKSQSETPPEDALPDKNSKSLDRK